MDKIFTFTLDILQSVQTKSVADIKTNDLNTAYFNVQVIRGRQTYDLTGATISLNIEKPDGTLVLIDGSLLDAKNGQVQFALVKQAYLVAGRHKAEVMIRFAENQISVSKTFYYTVEKGILDDQVLESRDEWGNLAKAIKAGEILTDSAIDMMQKAEVNEPVRIANENTRIANENIRNASYTQLRDYINTYERLDRFPYFIDGGDLDIEEDTGNYTLILDGGEV